MFEEVFSLQNQPWSGHHILPINSSLSLDAHVRSRSLSDACAAVRRDRDDAIEKTGSKLLHLYGAVPCTVSNNSLATRKDQGAPKPSHCPDA